MKAAEQPSRDVVAVLAENHRRFHAFLTRRVGNPADAEEILQSALVKGMERSDSIRDEDSVVAWFYRVLRNAVIDHYRSKDAERRALQRLAGMSEGAETPEPEVEQAICQCVTDLLPTLSEDYSTLLRRIDLEGEDVAQVAGETGMTANNVRVKLHRARKALRRQLELTCGACAEHACLDCGCRRPA